jgi:hypothetical protein
MRPAAFPSRNTAGRFVYMLSTPEVNHATEHNVGHRRGFVAPRFLFTPGFVEN